MSDPPLAGRSVPESPLPEPKIEPTAARRRVSYVWLVPVATLIILVTVVWQTYGDRGPSVSIFFDRGTGIEAGKTAIRHRGIQVGLVESVRLSHDTSRVLVIARMDSSLDRHLNDTTRFWVVRPRVTGSQVSGLDTLLGGTYIGVSWEDVNSGGGKREFSGLEAPPLTPAGTPGVHLTLRATEGAAIAVGAPVYFKNIAVGRMETRSLEDDGTGVRYAAFIDAPYDSRISASTRFWNVSGVSVELGSEGARLQVESLLALFEGGVAFDNLPLPAGAYVSGDGREFRLFPNRAAALASLLEAPPDQEVLLSAIFSGSVRGLNPGAPVEYRGVQVGDVKAIETDLRLSRDDVLITTVLRIQPLRISQETPARSRILDGLKTRVERGMRAQLATGNLLTGALYVNLVDRPGAPPETLEVDAEPYPRIPTVPSDMAAITGSAQSLIARIESLPLERTVDAFTQALEDLHVLLAAESMRALPANIGLAARNIGELAGSRDVQDVPRQLSATLNAARSLVAGLNESGMAERVTGTLQSAQRTAAALEKASKGLPELVTEVSLAARNAQAMLKGLEPRSELHYELQRALGEVRRAAQAVAALAVKLEAKPNAIILGK